LPDTKAETIQAKQREVKNEIQQKEQQIQENQEIIDTNDKAFDQKKAQIEAKQEEIAGEVDQTRKKELEADKIGLENECPTFREASIKAETVNAKLEPELTDPKVQDEKLGKLTEIGEKTLGILFLRAKLKTWNRN
jgi:chromosome segregation ATPase